MVGSAGDAGLEPSPPKAPTPRETELGLWPSYGLPPGRLNASDVDRRALAAAAAARPLDFVRPWTKREGPEIGVGAVEWAEDGVEVEEEEKSEVSHDIGGCEGGCSTVQARGRCKAKWWLRRRARGEKEREGKRLGERARWLGDEIARRGARLGRRRTEDDGVSRGPAETARG